MYLPFQRSRAPLGRCKSSRCVSRDRSANPPWFSTSPSLIGKFGYNFSPIFSPILFTLAACIWRCVSNVPRVEDLNRTEAQLEQMEREDKEKSQGYFAAILSGAKGFGKATYYGAYLVMTNRKYCWLFVGKFALAIVDMGYSR